MTNETNTQILETVISEFKSYGFIDCPKEPNNNRFLYKPSTVYGNEQNGIRIHISYVSDKNVYIGVYDRTNNGMDWGEKYHKFAGTSTGCSVKWDYTKRTFGRFWMTTFSNRVNKLLYKK